MTLALQRKCNGMADVLENCGMLIQKIVEIGFGFACRMWCTVLYLDVYLDAGQVALGKLRQRLRERKTKGREGMQAVRFDVAAKEKQMK